MLKPSQEPILGQQTAVLLPLSGWSQPADAVRQSCTVPDKPCKATDEVQSVLWIVGPYYGWTQDSIQGLNYGPY